MTTRRDFLIGTAALGLVASCGPPGPGAVTVVAQGAAGMNPGPDGADRPLTLQLVQLRGTGAFDTADAFALQDPATALGADLIKAEQVALTAGVNVTKVIPLDPGVTAIGVIAGYRDPAGKMFRAKVAVGPTDTLTLALAVTASGITLTPA